MDHSYSAFIPNKDIQWYLQIPIQSRISLHAVKNKHGVISQKYRNTLLDMPERILTTMSSGFTCRRYMASQISRDKYRGHAALP